VVVTLEPENPAAFDFIPDQHLIFRRDFGGQELRRSYSICASKAEGILQVGIKPVDGGTFSTWANQALAVGDRLQAMAPLDTFCPALEPELAHNYLGFAGGSDITLVLSILKSSLKAEPLPTFTPVYANPAISSIMFREELENLKNLYMGRLTIIHVLERDSQEIDLFTGRVDEGECALLFQHWIDIDPVDTAFICGPEPMMLGIKRALKAHGLTDWQIRFELFKSDQPGRARQKATSAAAATNQPTGSGPDHLGWHGARHHDPRGGAAKRPGCAVFLPRRGLFDLPRPPDRGRGRHDRQPRAGRLRGRAWLCPDLPVLSDQRPVSGSFVAKEPRKVVRQGFACFVPGLGVPHIKPVQHAKHRHGHGPQLSRIGGKGSRRVGPDHTGQMIHQIARQRTDTTGLNPVFVIGALVGQQDRDNVARNRSSGFRWASSMAQTRSRKFFK